MHPDTIKSVALLLLFVMLAAVAFAASAFAAGALGSASAHAALFSISLIAITVALLRLESRATRDCRSIDFRPQLGLALTGFLVAFLLVSLAVLIRAYFAEVPLTFQAVTALSASSIVGFALLYILPEELLFRGYLLRSAVQISGAPAAIVASSLLFGIYHIAGSQFWGTGLLMQFTISVAMGLVLAHAAVATRNLSLSVGLHLGGNVAQASLVPVPAVDPASPGYLAANAEQLAKLFAPDLIVQLPIFVAIAACSLVAFAAPLTRRAA